MIREHFPPWATVRMCDPEGLSAVATEGVHVALDLADEPAALVFQMPAQVQLDHGRVMGLPAEIHIAPTSKALTVTALRVSLPASARVSQFSPWSVKLGIDALPCTVQPGNTLTIEVDPRLLRWASSHDRSTEGPAIVGRRYGD